MTDQDNANPYDAVYNRMYGDPEVSPGEVALRQSMLEGVKSNPDQAAKALPIAEQHGVPLDVAQRNMDTLQKDSAFDKVDYKTLYQNYPTLSKFLSNPDNASLSHDDVGTLQSISDHIYKGVVGVMKGIPAGLVAGVSGAFTGIGATATRGGELLAKGLVKKEEMGQAGIIDHTIGQTAAGVLGAAGDVLNFVGESYKPVAEYLTPAEGSGANKVGETVGQFMPWIAATMATGGEAAMPYLFGASGAGSKLEQEKAEGTYDTGKGDLGALLFGIVNGALGSKGVANLTHGLPPSFTNKALEGMGKLKIPVGSTAEQWLTKALDLAYRGAVGATQMGGIQISSNATDKYLLGHPDKDLTEGVGEQAGYAGVASLILGSLFHVVGNSPTMFDEARAKASQDYLKNGRTVVQKSKLMERSPEKMNDLINQHTGGSDVHVNPEALNTFYQSLPPEVQTVLDAKMPDLKGKITDGLTTRADVPVNQADFMTYIQPIDRKGNLDDWTKLMPDHMTAGDLAAHDEFMKNLVDGVQEDVRNLKNRDRDAADAQSSIYDQLLRFTGVGRTPSAMVDVAKIISENPAKFMEVMSQRTGGRADVKEVLNRLIRDVQIKRVLPEMPEGMQKGDMDLQIDNLRNLYENMAKADVRATERDKKRQEALKAGVKPPRRYKGREKKAPTPIMDYLKDKGGIRQGSDVAKELAVYGVTKKTHPDLFNKLVAPDADQGNMLGGKPQEHDSGKYGLRNLHEVHTDNFEGDTDLHAQRDQEDASLVDHEWLLDQIVREANAEVQGTDEDFQQDTLGQILDHLGMDVRTSTNTEIKRAIDALYKEQRAALDQNNQDETFFQSGNQGFYSGVERAAVGLKQEKGTGDQMLSSIQNASGVKAEEIEWIGLDTFLKGKKNVTKQEIQDYISANKVDVEEVTLGGGARLSDKEERRRTDLIRRDGDLTEEEDQELSDLQVRHDDDAEGNDTKFSQYTIPGGKKYREVLLTLPDEGKRLNDRRRELEKIGGDLRNKGKEIPDEIRKEWADIMNRLQPDDRDVDGVNRFPGVNYKSPHFDQPNILAHLRLDDRIDTDGKKVLFIEEIQSDWHQKGRKQGYKGKGLSTEENAEFERIKALPFDERTSKDQRVFSELRDKLVDSRKDSLVPDAPLKKTWHETAFRRVVQMATAQGYDRVAWTTGEQQNNRYDLSKSIKEIEYIKRGDKYELGIIQLNGEGFDLPKKEYAADELEDVVGKEVAEKIIRGEGKKYRGHEGVTLEGLDLKIGGDGMKGFYDKILVSYAKKFGKKFGSDVKDTKIEGTEPSTFEAGQLRAEYSPDGYYKVLDKDGNLVLEIGTEADEPWTQEQADEYLRKNEEKILNGGNDKKVGIKVHSMDITPEMRDSVNRGVPLFQGGIVDPRGSITFTPEGGAVIRTFAGEDLSTVLHEFGHLYWKAMSEIVKLGNVPESVMGDWNAMREWVGAEPDAELTVEQEEKIADGFLDYLRRGEAPSADMQGAFSRFKGWLTRLYTGIRDTLPKISPEVKDVFDRMFATDEEIEAIRSIPEFTPDPSIMGMLTKPEREKYTQKMVKQIQDAKERLFREAMRQSERENTQAYKDLRAGIEAQATAQINDERVYRTFDEIIKAGGLDRKEVVRLWGKEALPYLTGKGKKLVGAKGADPDMMARIMGYSSHTDMRDALFNMKPKKEAIQELTDDEMLNRHGDMLKDGTIEGEALKAYHNNLRAELIHIEMTTAARAAKIPAPSKEAIKARAIQMLSDMVVKDIIPNRHYMAEVKSARAAGLAAGRKEYEKAAVAKGQQLLNHYLYRLALDHREDMDKQLTKWRKLVNRKDEKIGKSNDINFVNAARYILSRHGLGKADYDFNSWLEQLSHENTEENPAGDPEAFQAIQGAISTANTLPQVPYKMMPLTDFQALGDAVDALVQTGRDRSEYNAAGEKQKLKDVIAEITEQSLKHDSSGIASGFGGKLSPLDHAKSFILSADANIARAEHWVQKMDLGNSGPFRKYVWTPIKKGVLAYREERSELMKGLLDLLEPHRDRLHGERIEAPELMNEKTQETYTFSDLGHLLGMIVHLGNPSNRSKLLRGYGWSEDGMNRFMDRMYREGVVGKQDMDLAQSMWNMMKGLKPRLWTAHKEMYGYYPDAVISEPIQTPFGEYEGGYWPARVDSDVSDDGQKREDREAINDGANSYSFPTAGRGALKKRVQQYAAPLQMRLGLLPNHLDWALKFIHVEPAVKDVAKIALNKNFREAIRRIDPQTIPDMLIPYLQRTAKQITEVPAQGKLLKYVSNFVRTAQVNAGIQALGGNLANVGIHLTQFAPFIRETSGAHMAESTAKFLKDPLGMIEAHNEMSPELRTRQQVGEVNPMKEIGRILADQSEWDWKRQFDKNGIVRTAKTVGEVAHDNAYILQAVVWHITDHVGWDAAYNKAMEGTIKGVAADRDAAVEYADSLVRRIQGGHNPEDIANIQMRSALAKIFVFLHGWFNNMGNYTRTERYLINKTGKPLAQRSASHAYLWLMTSVMVGIGGETISGLVRGATPSQNDKYKREGTVAMHWLEDMAVGLVRFKTGQYAFLGPFVNNIISKYTDQNYSDHLTPSPLFDLVDTISRVPKDIYKMSTGTGNNASGAADILTTLGMVTGTPISALKKPVKYLIREHEGKEHPKNAIEFMRGVVGGPAPKE